MKQFFLFISACMVFNYATAQSNIPIPEFKNTINQVDTSKKTLTNLEKATGGLDRKLKALNWGGSELYLKISGSKSSVTFELSQTTFVVKLPDADTDPTTYVGLYKFDSDKDRRRAIIGSQGMLGGKAKNVDIPKIDLIFSKISPGSYLITTAKPLTKRSYGFIFDPSSIVKQAAEFSASVFAFDIN